MAKQTVTLKVEGMSCGHCVGAVTDALTEIGATDIKVNLEAGTVDLAYDNEQIEFDKAVAAIEDAGYDVVK
jgi:copper chaperone